MVQVSAGLSPPEAGGDRPIPGWSLACKVILSLYICPCPNLLFLQGHQSYWIKSHSQDHILT